MTIPVRLSIIRKRPRAATKGGVVSKRAPLAPLLDQIHINQLCVAIGSVRFGFLLDLLATELVERPATIRRAILAGDFARARHESHSLKGATTSVGAMALGKAAATIEHAPDLLAMAAAIDILDQQAARTRRAIANMLPTSLPGLRPV
jgi:HPt (histidine-containing phosphotransfer) domain-containing protein